jgi:hypothetical protein
MLLSFCTYTMLNTYGVGEMSSDNSGLWGHICIVLHLAWWYKAHAKI